jgi:hypothetical protein
MKFYKKLLILLICCLPLFVSAQEGSAGKLKNSEKKTAKLKAKKDQQALSNYQKAVKRVHKIQTKDTRKRMKQSLKESAREKPGHKDFFIKRWFSKKRK